MTVANGQEAVVAIPVVVPPIKVEVTLAVVDVEVRHVAVAIDLRDGTLYEMPSVALSIEYTTGVLRSSKRTARSRKISRSPDCIVCATLYVAGISHQLSLFF